MASFNAGRLPQVPSELRARVSFELTPECGVPENELRYPPNIFDLVVIRETFMYLEPEDKAVILRKVKKMLRPGGRVLIIDYCRGRPALSQTFQSHIRRWHYDCSSPAELEELLAHHFEVSLAEDHTQDFIKYMEEGLARIEENLGPSTWKVGQMDLDNSQEKIQDALKGLPEEVQKEASEAAMEKLKLYKASIESDIEIQKEDYHWVKDTWSLERQAAMDGDLKWYIFVGKKGDLSS
ncbi:Phosphoethanolamine N-methyltransferase 3 [Durusdinium trenchii]